MTVREVQERLREWVRSVLGSVEVSDSAPGSDPAADVVVYPLSLSPRQEVRDPRGREPLRFGLRSLVLTQGEEAADRLQQLLVAALHVSEWSVELEAPSPQTWLALNSYPRPAFVLDVDVAVPRPEPRVSLVLRPPAVEVAQMSRLDGQVLGPGSVPIPGARVELTDLNRVVYSDGDGRFSFPSVPQEGSARFRISAKGRRFVAAAGVTTDGDPLVIRCEPLEE